MRIGKYEVNPEFSHVLVGLAIVVAFIVGANFGQEDVRNSPCRYDRPSSGEVSDQRQLPASWYKRDANGRVDDQ